LNIALLDTYSQQIVAFINFVLVPLLTAVAFITFLYGVFNYFIRGADNSEKRSEGSMFVLYGVIGFVIIFSLWGLVNVGVSVLGVPTGGRNDTTLPYPKL
jgi:small-conductance mechanosensitive channel